VIWLLGYLRFGDLRFTIEARREWIMAYYENLPIYKKAMDLTVLLENTVRGFSRYHKYSIGADMRNASRTIAALIIKANSEKDKVRTLTEQVGRA